jgi:hypothetical protein
VNQAAIKACGVRKLVIVQKRPVSYMFRVLVLGWLICQP